MLLRGVLASRSDESRIVYAADSFSGIPEDYELEGDMNTFSVTGRAGTTKIKWANRYVAGEGELKKNLRRVGLYDMDSTRIVKGFFNESFAPGGELDRVAGERPVTLSLVRLDSDAFQSIKDSLDLLWDRISVGGVVIVDDFHIPAVRRAVKEFRLRVGQDTAGPVLPIGSDYRIVCNAKAGNGRARKGLVDDKLVCDPSMNGPADLLAFLEIYPTSAFFYKLKSVS